MSPNDSASDDSDSSNADREGTNSTGLGASAEQVLDGFDRRLIDLLSWLLETETRARIYIYLRQYPDSTSEEIATGTGLYPSTVREALVELHEEEAVTRQKRASEGAGNNPFEYEAIAPSDLVRKLSGQVQDELNAILNLDDYLDSCSSEPSGDSVTITIDGPDDE